jgi:ubiquitin-protein ligase
MQGRRLQKDIAELKKESGFEKEYGFEIHIDDENMTEFKVYIMGVKDTPYEYGVFPFLFQIPEGYPIEPPKVRFLNLSATCPQIHPNLYSSGKVCLSILGTWDGDPWSPLMKISSVIMQIRALLGYDESWTCEPGYENSRLDNKKYNWSVCIRYLVFTNSISKELNDPFINAKRDETVTSDVVDGVKENIKSDFGNCDVVDGEVTTPRVGVVAPMIISAESIIEIFSPNRKRRFAQVDFEELHDEKKARVA